jgi:adenine C2-methylase RlmN of 23S rRNA A2503 and tRNA A37
MIRKKYYIIKKSNLYFKRIYIPIENGITVCVCSRFNCKFGEEFNEHETVYKLYDSLSSNIYPRKYTYIYVDKE